MAWAPEPRDGLGFAAARQKVQRLSQRNQPVEVVAAIRILCRSKWARFRHLRKYRLLSPSFLQLINKLCLLPALTWIPPYGKTCQWRTMVIRDRIHHRLRVDQ